MTGPFSGVSSCEAQCPPETSMEFATSSGVMPDRTVSPKTHTTRPSLSNVLAPMSAASHAGRSCAARSAFAAFADSTATGLDGADGHEGSSCAALVAAVVGEVEEVGELEDELSRPSTRPCSRHTAAARLPAGALGQAPRRASSHAGSTSTREALDARGLRLTHLSEERPVS